LNNCGNVVIFVRQPDKLRVDTFAFGNLISSIVSDGTTLAMQQGKLGYEDSIRKYLPELPAYADAIKVRHLLHHTSGLRDYNTLLSIAGKRDEDAWDNRVVLQITARQKALNFEPGAEYLYSNTGYTLLATIVESGNPVVHSLRGERGIDRHAHRHEHNRVDLGHFISCCQIAWNEKKKAPEASASGALDRAMGCLGGPTTAGPYTQRGRCRRFLRGNNTRR